MANEDDELKWKILASVYGEEDVKDYRMWEAHRRMPGDTLTPYEWNQLTVEEKKKIIEVDE